MFKRKFLLLILSCLSVLIFACSFLLSPTKKSNEQNETKLPAELNDRQINILEAMELPTDPEQLPYSQLHSIQRIEEMLEYLEEKYDEEFVYTGYIQRGLMESEKLFASPKSRNVSVTVKVSDNGNFEDDYLVKNGINLYDETDKVEKAMREFAEEYFSPNEIFLCVTFVYPTSHPEYITDDDYAWQLSLDVTFFIHEDDCSREELEEFGRNFAQWVYDRRIMAQTRFQLLGHAKISEITEQNYADYYNTHPIKKCSYLYSVSVFDDRINDYDSDSLLSLDYTHEEFLANGRKEKWFPTYINDITYNDDIVIDKIRWDDTAEAYGFSDGAQHDSLQFEEINRLLKACGWRSWYNTEKRSFGWRKDGREIKYHVTEKGEYQTAVGRKERQLECYVNGEFQGYAGDVIGGERKPLYKNGEFIVVLDYNQKLLKEYFGIVLEVDQKNETGTITEIDCFD